MESFNSEEVNNHKTQSVPIVAIMSVLNSSYLKESAPEEEVTRSLEEVEVTAQRLVGQLVQVAAQHHHVARVGGRRQILRQGSCASALQMESGLPNKYCVFMYRITSIASCKHTRTHSVY